MTSTSTSIGTMINKSKEKKKISASKEKPTQKEENTTLKEKEVV